MLSNNKFLGKCWYGRQPWIRLAMESESMVEKGINFILCLFEGLEFGTYKFAQNGKIIPHIGRYSGLMWQNWFKGFWMHKQRSYLVQNEDQQKIEKRPTKKQIIS